MTVAPWRCAAIVAVVAACVFPGAAVPRAAAAPRGAVAAARESPDGSAIAQTVVEDRRHERLHVYSAAMGRIIPVDVLLPAHPFAAQPTLYLLDGSDAGPHDASWQSKTGVLSFLAARNVNVVHPIGGAASYYTDWVKRDPRLGVSKWRTFLTEELPPLIDATLHANGRNAIAGMSMSATSVLQLAEAAPRLYRAVASYSGCAQISDPLGYRFLRIVESRAGANPDNMYGAPDDPRWAANDPLVHADRLRGIGLFFFSGTGLPGSHDTARDRHIQDGLFDEITLGGVIETAVDLCTHVLQWRLAGLGIPATYDFPLTGTHSWGYWEDAFYQSWPVLAAGLGLPGS